MFKSSIFLAILGISFITIGFLLNSDNLNTETKKNDHGEKVTQASGKENPSVIAQKKGIKIIKVLDGDTVVAENGETIRYLGINAPENGEPYYLEALELNKKLVLGKTVKLEYDVQKKDRYGRVLAYVFIGNELINKKLVESGLAVSQTIQPNVMYQDLVLNFQKLAREKCVGIWQGICEDTPSCMTITAINANPKGDDTRNKNEEWIELENKCSKDLDLENWILKDSSASNKYIFNSFRLKDGSSVKIHSGCGENSETDLFWKCPEQRYAVWNNSGDHAYLYNQKGIMIADFSY